MDLPRVTLDEFLEFDPCWANDEAGMRRLRYYSSILGGSANALDILRLTRIPADDRLWAVLREDFVPAEILHEFACRCAERALSRVDNPDPRSVAAVAAKRKWLRGEIGDQELLEAWDAAWDAAWAAEQKEQIKLLISMLEGYECVA